MGETFYSALGVDDDADTETIRHAYRELVREVHPDVSDDPDAPERFKRLTTARDTLVDSDERARYDRLGHDSYVAEHVTSDIWANDDADGRSGTERPSPSRTAETAETSKTDKRRARESSDEYDRTAWLGDDGGPTKAERTASSTYRKRQRSARRAGRASTATSNENWQHASRAYQRVDTDARADTQPVWRAALAVLGDVGPWLAIHVVFILSAIATAWVTFAQLNRQVSLSLPMLFGGVLVVALVVFVSVVHVISQVYA